MFSLFLSFILTLFKTLNKILQYQPPKKDLRKKPTLPKNLIIDFGINF